MLSDESSVVLFFQFLPPSLTAPPLPPTLLPYRFRFPLSLISHISPSSSSPSSTPCSPASPYVPSFSPPPPPILPPFPPHPFPTLPPPSLPSFSLHIVPFHPIPFLPPLPYPLPSSPLPLNSTPTPYPLSYTHSAIRTLFHFLPTPALPYLPCRFLSPPARPPFPHCYPTSLMKAEMTAVALGFSPCRRPGRDGEIVAAAHSARTRHRGRDVAPDSRPPREKAARRRSRSGDDGLGEIDALFGKSLRGAGPVLSCRVRRYRRRAELGPGMWRVEQAAVRLLRRGNVGGRASTTCAAAARQRPPTSSSEATTLDGAGAGKCRGGRAGAPSSSGQACPKPFRQTAFEILTLLRRKRAKSTRPWRRRQDEPPPGPNRPPMRMPIAQPQLRWPRRRRPGVRAAYGQSARRVGDNVVCRQPRRGYGRRAKIGIAMRPSRKVPEVDPKTEAGAQMRGEPFGGHEIPGSHRRCPWSVGGLSRPGIRLQGGQKPALGLLRARPSRCREDVLWRRRAGPASGGLVVAPCAILVMT